MVEITSAARFMLLLQSLIPGVSACSLSNTSIQAQESNTDDSEISPYVQVLLRMDRNGDGMVDASEVPEQARGFVDSTVKAYVTSGSDDRTDIPIQTGDGINLQLLVERAARSESELKAVPAVPETKQKSENYELYAATMLGNRDTDCDGVLDTTEAESFGDRAKTLDFNGDGKITVSELEIQFRIGWDKGASRAVQDLPADFAQLDQNQNGQIEMHEFTTKWTEDLLKKFSSRDYNLDGVIESQEWLRFELNRLNKSKVEKAGSVDD